MEVTFLVNERSGNEIVQIDNCQIIFKNFSGKPSQFNREGDRNFAIFIDDKEVSDALIDKGWNVKIKPPREEGDDEFRYLPVKIKFNEHGPHVYLKSGRKKVKLDEESVSCLDNVYISNVNLDIRAYDWEVNGKSGRAAYLQSIEVTQDLSADRFAEEEAPEEMPWD